MSPSIFKRRGSAAVYMKTASKQEIDGYVQTLSGQGYVQLGTPIEYRTPMGQQQLRESAKEYAAQNDCKLVVEVQDPNPMVNPYNPYKYYLFQYQGSEMQPPEPSEPPSRSAPQQGGGQAGQVFAQFSCPYCRANFTTYVNPGRNVLTCPTCRRQSMVDVPQPSVSQTVDQTRSPDSSAELANIKLKSSYNTLEEMAIDCLEALGQIFMLDAPPIPFDDTGEFLYPFIRMKGSAYQHVGFRNMDMVLMKEATHDYKIIGSEQHSQSQANVNPHRDDLFSIKTLGGVNYLVLDEFKNLEEDQRSAILNSFYEFLTRYVSVEQ